MRKCDGVNSFLIMEVIARFWCRLHLGGTALGGDTIGRRDHIHW